MANRHPPTVRGRELVITCRTPYRRTPGLPLDRGSLATKRATGIGVSHDGMSPQLGPRRVIAPDGAEWHVGRRWLTSRPRLNRPRGREIASESLSNLGNIGNVDLGEGWLIATAALAFVLILIPVLFFGVELIILRAPSCWSNRTDPPPSALGGRGNVDRSAHARTSTRMARARRAEVRGADRSGRLRSISWTRAGPWIAAMIETQQ